MPRLRIDLAKIEENTRLVAGMLKPYDVRLAGVTKACQGDWRVAGAMIAGGAGALADSHSTSIARLRLHLPDAELVMLRSPVDGDPPSTTADLYYVVSVTQAEALLTLVDSRPLRLCLMVETGDGREGVIPGHAAAEAVHLAALPGVTVSGIATNTACAGNAPSLIESLESFHAVGEKILRSLAPALSDSDGSIPPRTIISAGGSGLLGLLLEDGSRHIDIFSWLTELRCGEALLLGKIPGGSKDGSPLPGAHDDAFILDAPVLEVSVKKGRRQVLAGTGIQDIGAGTLAPLDSYLSMTQVTSDYIALDAVDATGATLPQVGQRLAFIPSYHALLAAMTSPFVEKDFTGSVGTTSEADSPTGYSVSEDSVSEL